MKRTHPSLNYTKKERKSPFVIFEAQEEAARAD